MVKTQQVSGKVKDSVRLKKMPKTWQKFCLALVLLTSMILDRLLNRSQRIRTIKMEMPRRLGQKLSQLMATRKLAKKFLVPTVNDKQATLGVARLQEKATQVIVLTCQAENRSSTQPARQVATLVQYNRS